MPTIRPTRRRQRRKSGFSAAELQYLTGDPQPNANRFELIGLEAPTKPHDHDRIDELLARAPGVVTPERLALLKAENDAGRKDYHARYPEATA